MGNLHAHFMFLKLSSPFTMFDVCKYHWVVTDGIHVSNTNQKPETPLIPCV